MPQRPHTRRESHGYTFDNADLRFAPSNLTAYFPGKKPQTPPEAACTAASKATSTQPQSSSASNNTPTRPQHSASTAQTGKLSASPPNNGPYALCPSARRKRHPVPLSATFKAASSSSSISDRPTDVDKKRCSGSRCRRCVILFCLR